MAQHEQWVSASEARAMIEEAFKHAGIADRFTLSKMMRILDKGEIASQKSVADARKRIMRRSDVQRWIADKVKQVEYAA